VCWVGERHEYRIGSSECPGTAGREQINDTRPYGLAFWGEEKPYKGRNAEGFAILGAGGNIVVVFPELELVIATTGGSYVSRGWRFAGGELIPSYILPAVN
jgi:hypothetical protein